MIYKTFNIQAVAIENELEDAVVPCGTCAACCIKLSPILTPEEFMSGKYVYTLITSPNPNIPTIAIPRDETGCFYFRDNKCTIYEIRPKACRQFDCRLGHYAEFKNILE